MTSSNPLKRILILFLTVLTSCAQNVKEKNENYMNAELFSYGWRSNNALNIQLNIINNSGNNLDYGELSYSLKIQDEDKTYILNPTPEIIDNIMSGTGSGKGGGYLHDTNIPLWTDEYNYHKDIFTPTAKKVMLSIWIKVGNKRGFSNLNKIWKGELILEQEIDW